MIYINRKLLCSIMEILLALGQVGIAFAISSQTCQELDQITLMDFRPAEEFTGGQTDGPFGEVRPMGLSYSGRGFALKDYVSHDLMITVVNLMPPDPIQVQGLLASNKSIEEIRDEINAMQEKMIYRGFIKLDEMIYPLVDINSSTSDENSIMLNANVVEPSFDLPISNETAIVGIIKVMIAPYEGGILGNGKLILNRGPYVGSYDLSLDLQPIAPGG
jgi:hypothetical protein